MEAAILARVSNDHGGTSTSPAEQRDACERVIISEGWRIAGEYIDSDYSASRFALKNRPAWKRLLEAVRSGSIDVVVMWEPSRGSRELETWAGFLSLCRSNGVLIHVVTHHHTYDVRIARQWRTLAEDGIDAQYESEKISERGRRAAASRKQAGKPLGRAPFAYRRTYDPTSGRLLGQEPDENAPRVRQLITDIANGVPVSKAARTAGIRHQHALWIARNPAYAGLRPGADGGLVRAEWKPIVDEAVYQLAQEVLDGHQGARLKPGSYRSLLGRLAECGRCGGIIVSDGKQGYRCRKGHVVYKDRDDADLQVEYKLANLLEDPATLARFAPADPDEAANAQAEAARLRGELDEWAAAGVSARAFKIREELLLPQIEAAEQRAREAQVPPALRVYTGKYAEYNAAWNTLQAMPLAAVRDVIRTLVTVTINGRSSGKERVEVTGK